ncbi:hypothetical protein PG984_010203 [Apiospora sp. TS-2023a]
MRFSLLATIPAGIFSLCNALPATTTAESSSALPMAGSPETWVEGSNSTLEARAATCDKAYTLKLYKSKMCSGSATRTEIQNWPLEAGATDRCVNVNSKAALKGLTFQKGVSGVMYMYPKADCPERKNGFLQTFLPYAQRVITGGYCNTFTLDDDIKSYYIKTWAGVECKPY